MSTYKSLYKNIKNKENINIGTLHTIQKQLDESFDKMMNHKDKYILLSTEEAGYLFKLNSLVDKRIKDHAKFIINAENGIFELA